MTRAQKAPGPTQPSIDHATRLALLNVELVNTLAVVGSGLARRLLGKRYIGADVEHLRNIAYTRANNPFQTLDIYRSRAHATPQPTVVYIHGGAGSACSKDTHWMMAVPLAQAGYQVVMPNYRLAPQHAFPSGLDDLCQLIEWLQAHAADFGGDPKQLILAGESTGANLAAALTLVLCQRRHEPYALGALRTGLKPNAAMLLSGAYSMSDVRDIAPTAPAWQLAHVQRINDLYLGYPRDPERDLVLANPIDALAQARGPLCPILLSSGTADGLHIDTQRMADALHNYGSDHPTRFLSYDGAGHLFYAFWRKPQAQRFWRDAKRFLKDCGVPPAPPKVRDRDAVITTI